MEGVSAMTLEELDKLNKGNTLLSKIRQVEADMSLLEDPYFDLNWFGYKNEIMAQGFSVSDDIVPKMKEAIRLVLAEQLDDLRAEFEQL